MKFILPLLSYVVVTQLCATAKNDGYTLLNTKVSAKVIRNLAVEGRINNIYSLVEGFRKPEETSL